MSPIKGTVRNGVVRFRRKRALPEGQKVIVIPISSHGGRVRVPKAVEQEDIDFVRAGRSRLGRLLKGSENETDA